MHAGLPELIGELLPHEEVKQLPGLGHHYLVARHIVQSLEVFNMNTFQLQNIPDQIEAIQDQIVAIPDHNRNEQCSLMQCLEDLDQGSGLPKDRRCH